MKRHSNSFLIIPVPSNLHVQIPGKKGLEKVQTEIMINDLEDWLEGKSTVIRQQLFPEIDNFRRDPAPYKIETKAPKTPDGSPIGNIMCKR